MNLALVAMLTLTAAPRSARPPPPAKPPAPVSAPVSAPVEAEVEKPASALEAPEQVLDRAATLFSSLDYDQVLPLVRRVLKDPTLTTEQRVQALALEGSTLAITSDVTEAERPFRKLLRLKPDFDLSAKSPPKILAAFRKVQAEERQLAEETEGARRKALVANMRLLDELPTSAKGGRPLKFSLRIFDPAGAVSAVRVPYRKAGEPTYSVLALARDETGAWAAALPAELTASPTGFDYQLYLVSLDAKGAPLLTRGTEAEPLTVSVAPGKLKGFSMPRPAFYASAALTVAAGAASVGLGIALKQTQADLDAQTHPGGSAPMTLQASIYSQLRSRGESLATATTAMLISTGVLALTTVVFALLVDWSSPEP